MVVIGAGLIWLGWNGFNGGDPYGSTIDAGIAVLNTELAAAASVVAWILMDMNFIKKPTLVGATTACVTGLVAITPAAGYVNGYGALIIGIVAGTIPWITLNKLSPKMKVDDALGVFQLTVSRGSQAVSSQASWQIQRSLNTFTLDSRAGHMAILTSS